jgi:hypothetical protein
MDLAECWVRLLVPRESAHIKLVQGPRKSFASGLEVSLLARPPKGTPPDWLLTSL